MTGKQKPEDVLKCDTCGVLLDKKHHEFIDNEEQPMCIRCYVKALERDNASLQKHTATREGMFKLLSDTGDKVVKERNELKSKLAEAGKKIEKGGVCELCSNDATYCWECVERMIGAGEKQGRRVGELEGRIAELKHLLEARKTFVGKRSGRITTYAAPVALLKKRLAELEGGGKK